MNGEVNKKTKKTVKRGEREYEEKKSGGGRGGS